MTWDEFITPAPPTGQWRPWSEIIAEFAAKHDRPIFPANRVVHGHVASKLNAEDFREMETLWATTRLSVHDIAKRFGMSVDTVYRHTPLRRMRRLAA